ncbi:MULTISPECIES: BrnT family toxin [unclassified Duganella]|uniref:BrnT family toxin n=1 Tax=unclassified Duganella TaxID=2636909 RepID=UPI00088C5E69|nr:MULTISPECIES: BrnT family toxin [unclassified Duganella]SDG72211.1 hypothetical protein SAMN05216320_106305 [Duganella sp. OV458]SDJ98222.1 hypothetical protein SAMN05428973_107306 [Duganella sp. OV510]
MFFEWDESKNQRNIAKHGISFKEATKIFDSQTYGYFDSDHSLNEDRYIEIGFVGERLIAVVFVQLDDHTVRIISARKASLLEEQRYERGY